MSILYFWSWAIFAKFHAIKCVDSSYFLSDNGLRRNSISYHPLLHVHFAIRLSIGQPCVMLVVMLTRVNISCLKRSASVQSLLCFVLCGLRSSFLRNLVKCIIFRLLCVLSRDVAFDCKVTKYQNVASENIARHFVWEGAFHMSVMFTRSHPWFALIPCAFRRLNERRTHADCHRYQKAAVWA